MNYQDFLHGKHQQSVYAGIDVKAEDINPQLFKFQRDIVRWALQLGKAAMFEECGLGKTAQQLEWARLVVAHTGGKVIILAPLAVAGQTVREGAKFNVPVHYCLDQSEVGEHAIVITNYERLDKFDATAFAGVVLDESSILKSFTGKTKQAILAAFETTPYKLACTATPAPNDHLELGNHAEFLSVMASNEMISRWFINDAMQAGNYRLKKHAAKDFWRWLTSWAVCISHPRDLGDEYDLPGFDLPKLAIHEHLVNTAQSTIDRAWSEGRLLPDDSPSATGMHKIKRESLEERVANSAQIVYNKWSMDLINNEENRCPGNPNTTKPENANTAKIKSTGKELRLNSEPRKKTRNTCETTTSKTKSSSKSTGKTLLIESEKMPFGGSDIKTTPNTESNARQQPENVTKQASSTVTYNTISALISARSTQSLSRKMEDVPSVGIPTQTENLDDSTLTTIMKRELLEDYSAQTVIRALENLKTTPNYLEEVLNISLSELTQFVVWCDTDYEQRALEEVFGSYAISIFGALSNEEKERRVFEWLDYKAPILISKPSILGYGMNFQQCANQILVGLSYSFEKFYQAIRRSHRFGQNEQVNVHIIYAESEGNIMTAISQKQAAFQEMQTAMNEAVKQHGLFRDGNRVNLTTPPQATEAGKNWTMALGDCIPFTAQLDDNLIDFSIYSPPFANLYIYSDSEADMGNAADDNEFFEHYDFLIKELYRATRPGRLSAVHCKDLPRYMNRDGAAGLQDFPGEIIRRHEASGWQYHSRVTIWKDPVIEMQRTKNHGLLHKNFTERSEACRQGMPDYLLVFRKYPIEGGVEVKHRRKVGDYIGTNPPTNGEVNQSLKRSLDDNYSIAVWQRYASPVWFDIDQTNVLNYEIAKSGDDEKHICPLQLDVIERSIDLWTNPGELVYTPFAGIGSEVVSALKLGRKGLGVELKPEYHKIAVANCKAIEYQQGQPTLFDLLENAAV